VARSLIIDLGEQRGLFEEGVKVAGLFLPPNARWRRWLGGSRCAAVS
jgi:hypothetical protein